MQSIQYIFINGTRKESTESLLTVGDVRKNFEYYLEQTCVGLAALGQNSPTVVVWPELALLCYPPNDLIFREGLIDLQDLYVEKLTQMMKRRPNTVLVLGVASRNSGPGKPFFNSVIAISEGKIVAKNHKQLLPTYDVFDERRYFEPKPENSDVNGKFLFNGKQFGLLICEDCWNVPDKNGRFLYNTNPVLELKDCDVIVSVNASPYYNNKETDRVELFREWVNLFKQQFQKNVTFVYCNQFLHVDGLVFDGQSFVINSDGVQYLEQPLRGFCTNEDNRINAMVFALQDYVRQNKFAGIVVGSSGGIDSAVVLTLAALAVGPDRVVGITMPSKFSSNESVDFSANLCAALGVKLITVPIINDVAVDMERLERLKLDQNANTDLAIENLQARHRGRILMEFSNINNYLVVNTGNKSELSVGYFTLYGDSTGGLSLIGDLYKTEVYEIADELMEIGNKKLKAALSDIVNKPPSAELKPNQLDTDSLPPYPVLDSFLKLYLEKDLLTQEEIDTCRKALSQDNNGAGIGVGVLEQLCRKIDRSEFKRRQCPPIVKLSRRAFGAGRNIPISHGAKFYLQQIFA